MSGTKTIGEEIGQGRPFRSRSQEAALGLLRTADLVRRRFCAVVEPHGVTLQQYNVLRILRGAGAAGLPTLTIADRMVEQTPGITRLLDRLEKKSWVRRERCREDRRQVLCWISEAGLELLQALEEPMGEADDECFRELGEEDLSRLIALLDRAREGMR